jgi:hypothetical protein
MAYNKTGLKSWLLFHGVKILRLFARLVLTDTWSHGNDRRFAHILHISVARSQQR